MSEFIMRDKDRDNGYDSDKSIRIIYVASGHIVLCFTCAVKRIIQDSTIVIRPENNPYDCSDTKCVDCKCTIHKL